MPSVSVRYIVDDVDAAIAFYRDNLGFTEVMHPAPSFAMLSLGELRLVLSAPGGGPGGGEAMPDGRVPEPGGWNRFSIEVADLDAAVGQLRRNGASFRNEIVTGVGGRQILVDDPSGNPVELFEPSLPEARLRQNDAARSSSPDQPRPQAGGDAVTPGHHGEGRERRQPGAAQVPRDEALWDERYRSSGALWSGAPNPQLATEAAGLVPGAALDAGCGEGADAIWLAGRGWQVTAVDISAVALSRAAARAAEAGAGTAQRITWRHEDLTGSAPPASRYDLVSAQFMQLPPGSREVMFGRLAAAVAPGGSLLIVGHHPSDLQTTARRPPAPELFYTADDIAVALEPQAWDIVVSAARERPAADPDGRAITVRDTVLRARRRA